VKSGIARQDGKSEGEHMRTVALLICALAWTLVGCGSRGAQDTGSDQGKVVTSYDEAIASAKSENRPILIVAYQTGLDRIEQNLLNDPAVKERSRKVITAKLDAASQGQTMSQLGITQYPAVVILHSDGTEAWRSQGVPMPGAVAQALDQANQGSQNGR
jgi:hypothetical protein